MKDPAILFFKDKWLMATAEMDSDVRGWYLNLILHHFDKGSLPNDMEKLASLAGVKFSEFQRFNQVYNQVLNQKFVQNENGRLENETAKEILIAREQFKDKRTRSANIAVVIKAAIRLVGADTWKIAQLKTYLYSLSDADIEKHKDNQILNQVLNQMVNQTDNLYTNVNVNEIINDNVIEIKGGTGGNFRQRSPEQNTVTAAWVKFRQDNKMTPATFGDKEKYALADIASKIVQVCDSMGVNPDEAQVSKIATGIFLQAQKDKWLKDNFILSNINTRFDALLTKLKTTYERVTDTEEINYR